MLSSLGASTVKRLLHTFSCKELNEDVDSYLKRWAIYGQIRRAQGIVGGKVVFLEYERDRPKLLETYTKTHKFREFPMPSVEDKGGKLGQLFRFLD